MRRLSNAVFSAWLRKINVSEAAFMVDLLQTADPEMEEEPSSGRGSSCSSDSLFHLLNPQVSGLKDEREVWGSFLPSKARWVLIVAGFRVKLRWNLLQLNFTKKLKKFKKQLFRRFSFQIMIKMFFFLTQSLVCVCVREWVCVPPRPYITLCSELAQTESVAWTEDSRLVMETQR